LFEKEIQKAIQWYDEEDTILIKMKTRGQNWKEIMKELPGRSYGSCLCRYNRLQVTVYFELFFVLAVKVTRQYLIVLKLFLDKFVHEMLTINIINFVDLKFFGKICFFRETIFLLNEFFWIGQIIV
jgi:hypothetical protein